MSKRIVCDGCSKYLGELEEGSKLRKGMVHICADCNKLRKAAVRHMRTLGSSSGDSPFKRMFGDLFK